MLSHPSSPLSGKSQNIQQPVPREMRGVQMCVPGNVDLSALEWADEFTLDGNFEDQQKQNRTAAVLLDLSNDDFRKWIEGCNEQKGEKRMTTKIENAGQVCNSQSGPSAEFGTKAMKIVFERDCLEPRYDQRKAHVCAECDHVEIVHPVFSGTAIDASGGLENEKLEHWLCESCWMDFACGPEVSITTAEVADLVAQEIVSAATCRSEEIAKENLDIFIVTIALGRSRENRRLPIEDINILRKCSDTMPDFVLAQIGLPAGTSYAAAVALLTNRDTCGISR